MKNMKAIIGIILVFLLGAASGATVTHMIHRSRFETFIKGGPEAREEMIVKRLTHKLDLDSSQQEQVKAIVRENHVAIRQARSQCQPRIHELLEQGQTHIIALLRPEQQEKFRKIIAERKANRPSEWQ